MIDRNAKLEAPGLATIWSEPCQRMQAGSASYPIAASPSFFVKNSGFPADCVLVGSRSGCQTRRTRRGTTAFFHFLELSIVKKILLLVGVAVGGLVYAGAIHFQQNGNTIDISIDEQKVKEVAEKVIAEEQEVMKNAAAAHPTQAR